MSDSLDKARAFADTVIAELEERAPCYSIHSVERHHFDRALLALYGWRRAAPSLPADKNAVERVAVAIRRQFNIDEGFSEEQADSPRFQEENANFHNCARAAIAALSGHGE